MRVKLDGVGTLRFYFRHMVNQATECHCILGDEQNAADFYATAYKAKVDQFIKSKGRRVALGRLLSSGLIPTELTRTQRRVIWETYFSRHADLGGAKREQVEYQISRDQRNLENQGVGA